MSPFSRNVGCTADSRFGSQLLRSFVLPSSASARSPNSTRLALQDHSASSPSTRRSAYSDRSLASSLVAHSAFSPRSPSLPGSTSSVSIAMQVGGVLRLPAHKSYIAGLATSTSTLPPHSPPLPFLIKWGGSAYFMSQGVGIVLEGMYTALTRRKVGGYGGVLWSSLFVCLCGGMLYKSWCVPSFSLTNASVAC